MSIFRVLSIYCQIQGTMLTINQKFYFHAILESVGFSRLKRKGLISWVKMVFYCRLDFFVGEAHLSIG